MRPSPFLGNKIKNELYSIYMGRKWITIHVQVKDRQMNASIGLLNDRLLKQSSKEHT
jgi:hypothetical protein